MYCIIIIIMNCMWLYIETLLCLNNYYKLTLYIPLHNLYVYTRRVLYAQFIILCCYSYLSFSTHHTTSLVYSLHFQRRCFKINVCDAPPTSSIILHCYILHIVCEFISFVLHVCTEL